jgi:cytohesin
MSFIEFFSQPLWYRLGLTLTHFLWQGLVVVILISTFVRLFKLRAGNARYYAYLLAFVLLAISPVITFIVIDASVTPATKVPMTGTEHRANLGAYSRPVPYVHEASFEREEDVARVNKVKTTQSYIPLRQRIGSFLESFLPWAIVGWMIGVVSLSMRLLLGFAGICRWRRNLKPLPENLAQRVALLCKRLGMRHSSRVFISPLALQAMAVGYLRPLVLLPASMITQMQPEMLEAIIAHEMAHIRRFDLWINLGQRVIETLLFYHPAIWWLSSQLRSERELCCDELAITATGERLTYASALESAGTARFEAEQQSLSIAFGHRRNSMLGRVRHVLGLPPTAPDSRFWLAGAIAAVVLVVLAMPITFTLTAGAEAKAGTKSLHEAVVTGDIRKIRSLISEGTDVNAKDEQSNTPLHLVAKYGYEKQDIAELLIARGADVNARNNDGWIPLHFTAWRSYTGHRNIAELLIKKGADISARAKDGRMPLHYAARSGARNVAELLLAKGTDINARGWQDWTALHEAANWTAKSVVELLLANGADVHATSQTGWTPLHAAAGPGWPWRKQSTRGQIVGLLVDNGSFVNAKDSDGCTPLHAAAAWKRQGEVVEVLLARGANVDAKANSGATPLHYAAYNGQKGVVEILLAKGANINATTDAGDTPASAALQADYQDIFNLLTGKGGDMPLVNSLHSVARIGNLAEARSLIDKGVDVNTQDWIGWTALHYAAKKGNRDVIQLLVSRGAKVNVHNKDGLTPLHKVTNRSCAEILIAQNADINAKDNEDFTPMHYAAQHGHQDVVELLISKGADVNPTNECRKPLHLAVIGGHTDIVKLLTEKGADVNAEDCYSDVPLVYARTREIGEILLDNGANPNARDMSSFTTLHYAAGTGYFPNGSVDIVDLLISKGADVNLINGWGGTALSTAKRKGHTEIVELLQKHGAKE